MAEEKKQSSAEKSSGNSSNSSSSSGGSVMRNFGCGCLLLIMLLVSFLLGTLYGRRVFPYLFDKAHKGIDKVTDQAHEGIDKADQVIKEKEVQ